MVPLHPSIVANDVPALVALLDPTLAGESVRPLVGSFDKVLYTVGTRRILRLSLGPMVDQVLRLDRVAGLTGVPRVVARGTWVAPDEPREFVLLTQIPGRDALDAWPDLSPRERTALGRQTGQFLREVHALPAHHYDIGHYIPTIPGWSGHWRSGHEAYWDGLWASLGDLVPDPDLQKVLDLADSWVRSRGPVLGPQVGPRVLHNDFHPQNLIVDQGAFAGVIDWECSQAGEPDFDLAHLVHWALFPPRADVDLVPLVRGVLETVGAAASVPHLIERLTIYELEHEFNQLVWSSGADRDLRLPRIQAWLDGGVRKVLGG